MIQCKYCSAKTHFTSHGGTECHHWCRFCRHGLMFWRSVFPYVDVIPPHSFQLSSHYGALTRPNLFCFSCSGFIQFSENLRVSILLFSDMRLERVCYFGEVVRHLYAQKREFEYLPFYPSYTGLLVQAISTRLRPPVKTSLIHRHKSLSMWPKRQFYFYFGAAATYTRLKLLARIIRCMCKRFPPSWKEIESRTVWHRVTEVHSYGHAISHLAYSLQIFDMSRGCVGRVEKILFF